MNAADADWAKKDAGALRFFRARHPASRVAVHAADDPVSAPQHRRHDAGPRQLEP